MIWCCKRFVLSYSLTVWAQHKSPLLLLFSSPSTALVIPGWNTSHPDTSLIHSSLKAHRTLGLKIVYKIHSILSSSESEYSSWAEGHDGRFSRDSLPLFPARGRWEHFWHRQGYALFDVVHPAFPLPTTASPTLQGALKDGFGEAVMACYMPEPCKFPSLDSCQKRFMWTYKGVDVGVVIFSSVQFSPLTDWVVGRGEKGTWLHFSDVVRLQ